MLDPDPDRARVRGRHPVGLAIVLLLLLPAGTADAHDDQGSGAGATPATCTPSGPFGVPGLSGTPSQIGVWSPVETWPARATHSILLHTGKVLWWRNGLSAPTQLYDPQTATNVAKPPPSGVSDMLCTGHVTLADGRVLVMGGAGGNPFNASPLALIFDPIAESWTRVADMHEPRWYPTAKTLPDGRVVVLSGQQGTIDFVETPEIYDPDTDTWTLIHPAKLRIPNYPFTYLLPDGRLVYAGNAPQTSAANLTRPTYALDLQTQLWTYMTPSLYASNRGSAAMYRPGRILKLGGLDPATDLAETLDTSQPTPTWSPAASPSLPHRRANMLMLPDGKVLLVGGTTAGQDDPVCAIHAPELWDPDTDTWTQLASMVRPRMYHSGALLLPDARILAAGGDNYTLTNGEENAEIFSPPYLFHGGRPTVTDGPDTGVYGATIQIATPDAASVASVSLIRPGAVTHNFDQSQTFVPLTFSNAGSHLDVTLPADSNLAPLGYYMLFLVSTSGVPSFAHWIRLEEYCDPTPDADSDGYADCEDNCPGVANGPAEAAVPGVGDQTDTDADATGDACDPDDDNDGLLDVVETDTGIYVSSSDTGSDPRAFHSDADGIGDGIEVLTYGSNPVLEDSDGDGLDDDVEIDIYGTNPALADTDDDGLEDAEEIQVYATDPLNPDSDGDGFSDGGEIAAGTDPNNPASSPTVPALPVWGGVLLAGALLLSRRRLLRS